MVCVSVEFHPNEVVREAFTGPCEGKGLFLVLSIPLLCECHGCRYERNGLELSGRLSLQQNNSEAK